jgi:hypothetical protein
MSMHATRFSWPGLVLSAWVAWLILGCCTAGAAVADGPGPVRVEVPLNGSDPAEVDLGELVGRLAGATGIGVDRPAGEVPLAVTGLGGGMSRSMLTKALGPDVALAVEGRALVLRVDPSRLAPERRADWERRLRNLAAQAVREAQRRQKYGMHALKSYRPNDPARTTLCLVHGVNSGSGGFVHMVPHLEAAGYGLVVYDYPFNRGLEASTRQFTRDWQAFRRANGEKRRWAVVAHSMGALVSRGYVEGPEYADDVASLVMIAPVNRGSHLARTQTFLQLLDTFQLRGGRRSSTDAMAHLGDGLGEAAADMTPGSPFLRALNARPRRSGVPYHIIAGDVGVISKSARQQIEAQAAVARNQGGLIGGLTRLAGGNDLSDRLDELADGTGDGCVSVARTRLSGVPDPEVIHANHAELIRAPLLFRDPGPVACMPALLRCLAADLTPQPGTQSP